MMVDRTELYAKRHLYLRQLISGTQKPEANEDLYARAMRRTESIPLSGSKGMLVRIFKPEKQRMSLKKVLRMAGQEVSKN